MACKKLIASMSINNTVSTKGWNIDENSNFNPLFSI